MVLSAVVTLAALTWGDLSPSEVGELVRRAIVRPPGAFRTVVEATRLPAVPVEDAHPPANEWVERETMECIVDGDRFRIDLVVENRAEGWTARRVAIWDGEAYWVFQPDDRGVVITDKVATLDTRNVLFPFIGIEGSFQSKYDALDVLVAKGRTIEQVRTGSEVTHRFVRDESPTVCWSISIEDDEVPRLLRWSTAFHETEPEILSGAEPRHREERVFSEWREYGAALLPSHAIVETAARQALRADEPAMMLKSQTCYERTRFETVGPNVDQSLFRVEMTEGLSVVDQRIGVRFVVGSREMVLDGMRYELADPLRGLPGERLGEIVRTARILGPAQLSAGEMDQADEGVSGIAPRIVIGALIAGGVFLLLLGARSLASRRASRT